MSVNHETDETDEFLSMIHFRVIRVFRGQIVRAALGLTNVQCHGVVPSVVAAKGESLSNARTTDALRLQRQAIPKAV